MSVPDDMRFAAVKLMLFELPIPDPRWVLVLVREEAVEMYWRFDTEAEGKAEADQMVADLSEVCSLQGLPFLAIREPEGS